MSEKKVITHAFFPPAFLAETVTRGREIRFIIKATNRGYACETRNVLTRAFTEKFGANSPIKVQAGDASEIIVKYNGQGRDINCWDTDMMDISRIFEYARIGNSSEGFIQPAFAFDFLESPGQGTANPKSDSKAATYLTKRKGAAPRTR
jgi:hypothetical protein